MVASLLLVKGSDYSDDGGRLEPTPDDGQYFQYNFYGADKFVKGGYYTYPMMKYSLTGTGEVDYADITFKTTAHTTRAVKR